MLEIKDTPNKNMPKVMVIGIGGGGNNAIIRMMTDPSDHVSYAALNTDAMTLDSCPSQIKFQLGTKLTQGFGAGGDPTMGEAAAKESEEEITELVKDANMVILTCGMGGGTGTGAIPIVAQICRNLNILTIAVVTMPFSFESKPRVYATQAGIKKLEQSIDTLLVIQNDKLLTITDKPFYMDEAFDLADSVLKHIISGITNIIFNHGTINLDFNDLKSTLKDKGYGLFGIGIAKPEETLVDAMEKAMCSPLLDTSITGASNILINTSGKVDIVALNKAIEHIREQAGENVNIFWGTVSEKSDSTDIVVTLIATGMKQVKSTNTIPTDVKKQIPVQPAPLPATKTPVEPNIDTFKQVNINGNNPMPPLKEIRFQVKPTTLQVPEFLKQHNK